MAYRLNYSDYSTTSGPPDPAAWVGPPGPPGPPGPMPEGGPFLPLTGGTVAGSVSIGADQPNYVTIHGGANGSYATITSAGPQPKLEVAPALNGALHFNLWRNWPAPDAENAMVRFDYNAQGNNTGHVYSAEVHAVNGDTVTGDGFGYFNFLGGPNAGAVGGRTAFGVNFQPSGITNVGASNFYVGSAVFCSTAYNGGGASGATVGGFFASNDMALLYTGATWWEELCGYELDVGISTGASASYKHGIKVNLWNSNAVAGNAGADTAYSTSSNSVSSPTAGWDVVYAVGDGYGYWPVKTTGKLIGTVNGPAGGPARQAAWGVDFSTVTFSGGLIRGPGFTVNGNGGVVFGGLASGGQDLSKHIDLHSGVTGFCADVSGTLNYNVQSGDFHNFFVGGALVGQIGTTGINQAAIGQTTAAVGSFTNLSASGSVTGAGFTALLAAAPFVPLAGGTMSNAIHFSGSASAFNDLSKHIDLKGGTTGFCVDSGGTFNVNFPSIINVWYNSLTLAAQFSSTGLNQAPIGQTTAAAGAFTTIALNTTAGPTIRAGTGAATGTQPKGSIWLRTDGAAGSTLYVTQGGGTWAAVASV